MNTKITSATVRGIRFNSDAATRTFFDALADKKFRGTRCKTCHHVPFPPREHCVACGASDVEWIDLPTRGTLHAFSQQQRSWRFARPDVIGLVELPGVTGLVLTKIAARIESLALGLAVELAFLEVGPGLTVHQFVLETKERG